MRVYLAGPPYPDPDRYRYAATELLLACGFEPVNPMLRDYRDVEYTDVIAREIVHGDIAELASCGAVLADFSRPDEGTTAECWVASTALRLPVYAFNEGARISPWSRYIATVIEGWMPAAVQALEDALQ